MLELDELGDKVRKLRAWKSAAASARSQEADSVSAVHAHSIAKRSRRGAAQRGGSLEMAIGTR